MTRNRWRPMLAIVCGVWLCVPAVSGQQPAPATTADVEALKKQIQALIAGQLAMQKQLDEIKTMIRAAPPSAPAAPAPSPVTVINTVVDIAGSPVKGSPTATLTMVEFSDFECPFCGRYSRDAYKAIDQEYISTGKVRYVFRQYPLESIHPHAFKAGVASLCAGEQGKFWELHDRFFVNQTALSAAALPGHAQAVGLEMLKFNACMTSEKTAARVRQDQTDAVKAGVASTPSFLIGMTVPGDTKVRAVRMVRGAQQYGTFKAAIDALLASK